MDAQATTARLAEAAVVGHAKETKMTDAKVKNLMPICAAKGLLEQVAQEPANAE